jgi:phosphoglycerate dehydrogenase-like enzyme
MVFDPFMSDEKAKELGVIKSDLDTIFSECQTISNHLAKNEKTNGLLNYSHFSKMRDYTTFINTARGSIVNEEGLKKAMRENPTLCSILDVIDPDEFRDKSDDLFSVDNIIVTPHSAGSQTRERKRLGKFMVDEYHAWINNQSLKYEVHLKDLETMA